MNKRNRNRGLANRKLEDLALLVVNAAGRDDLPPWTELIAAYERDSSELRQRPISADSKRRGAGSAEMQPAAARLPPASVLDTYLMGAMVLVSLLNLEREIHLYKTLTLTHLRRQTAEGVDDQGWIGDEGGGLRAAAMREADPGDSAFDAEVADIREQVLNGDILRATGSLLWAWKALASRQGSALGIEMFDGDIVKPVLVASAQARKSLDARHAGSRAARLAVIEYYMKSTKASKGAVAKRLCEDEALRKRVLGSDSMHFTYSTYRDWLKNIDR